MQQRFKPREMTLLGLGHPADFSGRTTTPEHIELTLVDPCRPVLAGMIDTQHARDLIGRAAVSRQAVWTRLAHAISRLIPARRRGRRSRQKTARQLLTMTRE